MRLKKRKKTKERNGVFKMKKLYFKKVEQYEVLSKEEETRLGLINLEGNKALDLLKDCHDEKTKKLLEEKVKKGKDAREKLILHNQRFVIKIAKAYLHRGEELDDLVSIGNSGLEKTLDHFDPSISKISTFSKDYIEQEIKRHLSEDKLIRIPYNVTGDIIKMNNIKNDFNNRGIKINVTELAELMNKKETYVLSLIENSMSTYNLDDYLKYKDGSYDDKTLLDTIEDPNENPYKYTLEKQLKKDIVIFLNKVLNDKELVVVRGRFGLDGKILTYKELGEELNVSHQRIEQIYLKAIEKMQKSPDAKILKDYYDMMY